MSDTFQLFVLAAVVGAVLMAALTKSLGGAFLGVCIVSVIAAVVGFTTGGLGGFVGGVLTLVVAVVALVLTMAVGVNFSHSVLSGHDSYGNPFSISQSTLGEGAKSAPRWNLPSGSYKEIGPGER